MKYKIFVIDADDNHCVYRTGEYEIQDGVLKIIDGELYVNSEWIGKHTSEFPLHRVKQIDHIDID